MNERTAADEAAKWVLRLQEAPASTETFLEWQRWLTAAPENKAAFRQMEEMLLCMARLDAKPTMPSMAQMVADGYDGSVPVSEYLATQRAGKARPRSTGSREVRRARPNILSLRYALAASVAALIIACAWFGFESYRDSHHGRFAYATAPGQRMDFTLPDGSRITLDADSVLKVELTSNTRSLRLTRGEGYFRVAKDASRPFIVSAGGVDVRALGTEFNVRMAAHRTVVAVVKGVVQLMPETDGQDDESADADTPPVLKVAKVTAGQAIAYAADGNFHHLPDVESSLATAWLEGRRQYRNEPLVYVLADIDRYTGQRIEVADAETGALKFTGTLNLEKSDVWLKGLAIALPVKVTRKPDGTLIVKRRTKAEDASKISNVTRSANSHRRPVSVSQAAPQHVHAGPRPAESRHF